MRRQVGKRKKSSSDGLVRENKEFLRRKSIQKSPRGGLQIIADRLNDLPELRVLLDGNDCAPVEANACAVWALAERIIGSPSLNGVDKDLHEATKRFDAVATQHPVTLRIEYPVMRQRRGAKSSEPLIEDWEKPSASVSWLDDTGAMLWHLWQFYFCDGGWKRLKRCRNQDCSTWFVDMTKNQSTARCSITCTDKYWSRDRRKEAKLEKKKKGVTSHGTKRR